MNNLASQLVKQMPELTSRKVASHSLANAKLNQIYIEKTVKDLAQQDRESASPSAIVIGAGPSLHIHNHIQEVLKAEYDGSIICADGALGHCLRNGLAPDYVVTVDSHPSRIVRWFGDPDLKADASDDYFRRQDLDPYIGIDEMERNRELIAAVNKYGPRIKAIVCTSVAPNVTKRCLDAGMDIYWWNPMFDDFADSNGLTQQVYKMNKVPCMTTGGNCGSSAWVFAQAILGKREVALTGMDFSYAPGTPLQKTQHYNDIVELFGERAPEAYISVHNPYLDQTWFTDPPYYWYRQNLLQMVQEADCTTFNCTEGGILFGEGIEFISLADFITSHTTANFKTRDMQIG